MKKSLRISTLILLSSLLMISANAQLNVSGTITDATTNQPLPGVSIVLKQTGGKALVGTVTDRNGDYQLQVPRDSGTLQVSFIGYKSQEIAVTSANASSASMKLTEDVAKLDEVVITGLATTVKRSNLANAVSTVSAKELMGTTQPTTFDQALSGKIVGANIVENSGAPGGGVSIKLRGVTTLNAQSQPLYVVDGVFFNNSAVVPGLTFVTQSQAGGNPLVQDNMSNRLADLNPNDIERVEVLKGASAAAIYGSQAAAGVIVITTKKGKATGRTTFNLSQDLGVATASKLLGVRHFDAQKIKDTYYSTDTTLTASSPFIQNLAARPKYDYEEEMYGEDGLLTNTRLSLTGGNDRTSFYVSGTVKSEDGIVKNTGYKFRGVRANIDQRMSDRVSLALNTSYENTSADRGLTNNDNAGVTWGVALSSTPEFIDLHPDAQGNYPSAAPFAASNVLQTRDLVKNNETVNRTTNSLSLNAFVQQNEKTYTKLVWNSGLDFYNLKTFAYFPNSLQFESNGAGTGGANIQGSTNSLNLNASGFAVNSWYLRPKLNLTTSIGVTYESQSIDNILNTASHLIGTEENLAQAGALTVVQTGVKVRSNGYFAQEEINFKDQLMLTGGIRFDRSTNNGDIDKYYSYPKVSLAWNVSNMDFWKGDIIDNLKLRVAYGESGNLPNYGAKFTFLSPANTGGLSGSLIGSPKGNDQIKPERQTETEAGFDISFFKGRLSLEATYYVKKAFDLLVLHNLPPSTGFRQGWINGGALQNEGGELALGILPIQKENFKWNLHVSWWKNKSKITQLDVPAYTYGGFGNTLGTFYIEQGKSATQIVGIPRDGEGHLTVWGDAEPDFQMSFLNEFTILKNFTLTVFIHWKQGGDNINLTELLTDLGGTSFDYDSDDDGNGRVNGKQRVDSLGTTASIFIQESSYVRFREIGLYYTFPQKSLNKFIKGIRIGASANNYITITDYKSYDPEVSNFGINGISTGVEVTPFPAQKRLFFHLSLDF